MWVGYVTFGVIADAFGRKRAYVTYVLMASVLLPLYGIFYLIVVIIGTVRAGQGEDYRYPLTVRVVH